MSDMVEKTSKWYKNPYIKQMLGYALALVLGYLASRFNVQPVEIKIPDTMGTKEVHYHIEANGRPSVVQHKE